MSDYSQPSEVKCLAAFDKSGNIRPHTITRRACGPDDVVIKIRYAGICHSDIHTIREEWGPINYPSVVGHEIGGHIVAVGPNVTSFAVGDVAGVGCMVDSCRTCSPCKAGDEQYCCGGGMVGTYASRFRYSHCQEFNENGGGHTQGGYSQLIVVDKSFVLKIPENLNLAGATPLLCAGITMYSPMMYHGLRPNMKFAVAGLGGLGHMGIKLAKAMGCHTTVISRGVAKREDALNNLGAHEYLDINDAEAVKAASNSFDFIIDTIAAEHDIPTYVGLLGYNGKLVMVGAPPELLKFKSGSLIGKRKTITGSLIGGIKETQEMLDFCGRHNIICDFEMINASQINEAHSRTIKSDVKYRFVIDVDTI